MLKEKQKIQPGEGDAADFIALANAILGGMLARHPIKEVVFVKIKNWFDHQWLNYSGNTIVPFDFGGLAGHDHHTAKESVWREKVSIPPFHRHRVLSSKFFMLEETGNAKIHRSMHRDRPSSENIHNRIADYLIDGVALWYSSHSEALQRGSIMVYRVKHGRVLSWYATFENRDGWKATKTKDISINSVHDYVQANVLEKIVDLEARN